jgi:hypothetical protein
VGTFTRPSGAFEAANRATRPAVIRWRPSRTVPHSVRTVALSAKSAPADAGQPRHSLGRTWPQLRLQRRRPQPTLKTRSVNVSEGWKAMSAYPFACWVPVRSCTTDSTPTGHVGLPLALLQIDDSGLCAGNASESNLRICATNGCNRKVPPAAGSPAAGCLAWWLTDAPGSCRWS